MMQACCKLTMNKTTKTQNLIGQLILQQHQYPNKSYFLIHGCKDKINIQSEYTPQQHKTTIQLKKKHSRCEMVRYICPGATKTVGHQIYILQKITLHISDDSCQGCANNNLHIWSHQSSLTTHEGFNVPEITPTLQEGNARPYLRHYSQINKICRIQRVIFVWVFKVLC